MKSKYPALVIIVVIVFAACSSPKKSTNVWVNKEKIQGKSFSSVFIVVMTADIQARVQVENDLSAAAVAKGYKTIKSYEAIPPSLDDPKMPAVEEIKAKVETSGCDAVFIASLLRKEEDASYVPGHAAYSKTPNYMYYTGYYTYWVPSVSTSDYYSHDKRYFIQSNLYEAASGEVMWSVQSEVFNPESIKKFSKAYTSSLIDDLEGQTLLKKK